MQELIIDHPIFGICKLVDTEKGSDLYTPAQWEFRFNLTKEERDRFTTSPKPKPKPKPKTPQIKIRSRITDPAQLTTMGKRIRAMRKSRHIVQTQLAEYVDVSISTISQLEVGSYNNPRKDIITAIAKFFNITYEELTGTEATPEQPQ